VDLETVDFQIDVELLKAETFHPARTSSGFRTIRYRCRHVGYTDELTATETIADRLEYKNEHFNEYS